MDKSIIILVRLSILSGVLLLGLVAHSWRPPTAEAQTAVNFKHIHFTVQHYQQKLGLAPTDFTSLMVYHNGPISTALTAFSIFWDPSNTISATYQNLVNRYLTDIGHSNFYNVATQYSQSPPTIFVFSNSSFGGTYHDTTAYPGGRGSAAHPLTDADIQAEVSAAIAAKGWPTGGLGVEFFVFTSKGVESCISSTQCTIGTVHPVYCAYHGAFGTVATPILYANMPYAATWDSGFTYTCATSAFNTVPNNHDADEEISLTSHEHFETVTDPVGYTDGSGYHAGWYDPSGAEIGDKCAYYYGTQAGNGSDVIINGNPYLVQEEWSNINSNGVAYSGCSLNYSVDTSVSDSAAGSVNPGKNLTYTIGISNHGPSTAFGVNFTDTVPANATFVTLTQTAGPAFGCIKPPVGGTGTANCSINSLTSGSVVTFSLAVKINANAANGTLIIDQAFLSQSATNSNSADQTAAFTSTVSTPTLVGLSRVAVGADPSDVAKYAAIAADAASADAASADAASADAASANNAAYGGDVTMPGGSANGADLARINITWQTATGLNDAGFNIYRGDSAKGPYERINPALVAADTDLLLVHVYRFVDASALPGKTYFYEIEEVLLDGTTTRQPPVIATAPTRPGTAPNSNVLVSLAALSVAGAIAAGCISRRLKRKIQ